MRQGDVDVLLDSNIWRYLADCSAGGELAKRARRNRVRILIAPAVVYEALRSQDDQVRDRLVEVMTHRAWHRLMPEIHEECMELLGEVRRLRPEWLLNEPTRGEFARRHGDWAGPKAGFWTRVRMNPASEQQALATLEEGLVDQARESLRAVRMANPDLHGVRPSDKPFDILAISWHSTPAWRGLPVAAWRCASLSAADRYLGSPGPFYDWLRPFLDIGRVKRDVKSWHQFWFNDVRLLNVRRWWIRWAFEFEVLGRKVEGGTPCDLQIVTHLVECDWFVTADRRLGNVIESCRKGVEGFEIGRAKLVPGGVDGVSELFDFLRTV